METRRLLRSDQREGFQMNEPDHWQAKHIPDLVAIGAYFDWRRSKIRVEDRTHMLTSDVIHAITGAPYKVIIAKLQILQKRGLMEGGVSDHSSFPTSEGIDYLHELLKSHDPEALGLQMVRLPRKTDD